MLEVSTVTGRLESGETKLLGDERRCAHRAACSHRAAFHGVVREGGEDEPDVLGRDARGLGAGKGRRNEKRRQRGAGWCESHLSMMTVGAGKFNGRQAPGARCQRFGRTFI
jgi:hypothetical protein